MSASDLLAKTSLYKVGHHGSHNATLSKQGLELMTHPELVAMLPVEADGVARLGYGQMPLKSLMKALREKTDGRILRIDDTWTNNQGTRHLEETGTQRLAFGRADHGRPQGQDVEAPALYGTDLARRVEHGNPNPKGGFSDGENQYPEAAKT